MKGLRLAVGALALLILAVPALATREISFSEAYALALENNKDVLLGEVTQRRTALGEISARALLMPSATANAGIEQTEPGFEDRSSALGAPGSSRTRFLQATLRQPIYTGGRAEAERRKAELARQASTEEVEHTRKRVYKALVDIFADIRKAEEVVEVNRLNIDRLEEHLEKSRIRFEVGEVEKTVLLQSQMQLSEGRADYFGAVNALRLLYVRLANVLGLSDELQISGGLPDPFEQVPELATLLEQARENRSDLQARQLMLGYARNDIQAQISKYLPKVAAQVQYRNNGTLQRSSDNLQGDDLTLGLQLEIPIFEGGTRRADYRDAKYNLIEKSYEIARTQEQIRYDIHAALSDIDTLGHRLREAHSRITLAEENLRMVRLQFEVGEATNLDLLDAINELRNSELALVQHRFDELKAKYALLDAVGAPGVPARP